MNSWRSKLAISGKTKFFIPLADQCVVSATNFFLGIFVVRICGVQQFGAFNICISLALTTTVLQTSLILLPYAIYRNRISENDRKITIGESLNLFVFILLFSYIVCYCYVILVDVNTITRSDNIFTICFFFYVAGFHFREFCRSICVSDSNFFIQFLVGTTASTIIFLILFGLFIYNNEITISSIFMAATIANICGALIWFKIYRSQIAFSFRLSHNILTKNWRVGRWILASNAPFMINLYVSIWSVSILLGPREVGIFAASNTLVMIVNPAVTAFYNFILPQASNIFGKNERAYLYHFILKSAKFIGFFLGIFCLFICIFGDWLLIQIYGPMFAGNRITISLLSIAVLIRSVSMPLHVGLLVSEKAYINTYGNFLALIINLSMNVVLIPAFGVVGSAVATILGEVIASAVRWSAFYRLTHHRI